MKLRRYDLAGAAPDPAFLFGRPGVGDLRHARDPDRGRCKLYPCVGAIPAPFATAWGAWVHMLAAMAPGTVSGVPCLFEREDLTTPWTVPLGVVVRLP